MSDSPAVTAGLAVLRHLVIKPACDAPPVDRALWLFSHADLQEKLAAACDVRADLAAEMTEATEASRREAMRIIAAGGCW